MLPGPWLTRMSQSSGEQMLELWNLLTSMAPGLVSAAALVGLILSAPVIAVLAILIKRESPDGPVFFRQTRIGAGHRPFTLWKLRSMRPDAAATDSARQSTAQRDPRLLRLGAFIRATVEDTGDFASPGEAYFNFLALQGLEAAIALEGGSMPEEQVQGQLTEVVQDAVDVLLGRKGGGNPT